MRSSIHATLCALLSLSLTACRNADKGDAGEIGYDPNAPVDADDDGYMSDEDCDDDDPLINPGALETCNDADDDCNGLIDDGLMVEVFDDADGDGYGDPLTLTETCSPGEAQVSDGTDCDDDDDTVHPTAPERCDELDNDCDGDIDEDVVETWYADADGDGFGNPDSTSESCDPADGWVADDTDCDDLTATTNPDAEEICDEADNDCDGTIDEDVTTTFWLDGDTDDYGDAATSVEACEQPEGYATTDGDCDDADSAVNPEADELCNGVDDDCDGDIDEDDALDASTWYTDSDSDGYGDADSSTVACDQPSGFVSDDTDCDDGEEHANPGEAEVCDEIDNDCDGDVDEGVTSTWYLDYDGDGYGDDDESAEACEAPTSKYVEDGGDCDDTDTAYNPDASEGCDGEDYDCDGDVDNDGDGDGYADESCGGDDCDDTDDTIYPEQSGDCALGDSCRDILDKGYSTGDDVYSIDPDGYATGTDPEDVWCDMSTESGGWTLVALNAGSGFWNTTTILNDTTFGSVSDLTSDYKAHAFDTLVFVDLMFDDGTSYAVYEGVGDDTIGLLDFMDAIPQPTCSSSSGYYYSMTAGTFGGGDLCDTNLYIHPIDMDGGYNSSCAAGYVWGDDATGPAWSESNNNGCPLDDPSGSTFINYGSGVPWSTSDPLMFYVR